LRHLWIPSKQFSSYISIYFFIFECILITIIWCHDPLTITTSSSSPIRLSPMGHMHFRHANSGLDASSKMHVVISNARCKIDVWAIQKYSSLSITCCMSLTWEEMDVGLLQSKMHSSLSFYLKLILVCMLSWREVFLPQHTYEHAKYIWMPIWMVDWAQPKAVGT
jgi:hypothetical protein